MVSGVARPMVMISMGSPGTRWMEKKAIRETPIRTGIIWTRRPAMNCSIFAD